MSAFELGFLATPQRRNWYRRKGKRRLDLVLSVTGLVLLSPLLLALWLLVRCSSRGPVLFRQERLGLYGSPFRVLKFRTMHVGTDDRVHRDYVTQLLTSTSPELGGDGLFKLADDPRVTVVGHLLRRTSLDELPQLINVLHGQMSLVGPRPCLPWERELYDAAHLERFSVPPGITGLWQVSGRSRLSMRQALDLDVRYAREQSAALDLSILARTLPTLIRHEAS